MSLKNFIKENFVLVVGLTLPVLLVVVFFLASVLPKSLATPPQYEMLFTESRYDYQNPPRYSIDFVVRDGAVKASVSKHAQKNYNTILMAYDGKTQSVREIPYDLSKSGDVADGSEVVLDALKNAQVDSSTKAPDGYEFNTPGYHSGGLVPDILSGGGYRNNGARVTKGAVSFKIPDSGNGNYYNIHFVGWVVGKK